MNQKIIIGIVAILVIAAGAGLYSSNSAKTEIVKNDEVMQKEGTPSDKEKDTAMIKSEVISTETVMQSDSYVPYTSEKIALASATHKVVLFFHASWCPTCRALDKDIKAHLKDIPTNLTILDVDYDTSVALKQKYGVTYQHTFVEVDAKGEMIKKWSGSHTLAALIKEVK